MSGRPIDGDAEVRAVLDDWARSLKGKSGIERDLLIADKATALQGVLDDPLAEVLAALERVGGNGARPAGAGEPDTPLATRLFLDWPTFWDRDHSEAEWVYPDVLARGRGHAIYAAHKDGKSLLMLWIAAALATGSEPVVVCYFDYENTEADIFDRLADMGYGPETDFSRLHYALLPTLPPLDTAAGAKALTEIIDGVQADWPDHHVAVVIDTIARAVAGEENSADTYRGFYNHTGIELKRRGLTWARLDHSGKDKTRGQRGSSGKGDDVDVVWRLTRTQNGINLHRDLTRMPWVPERVVFGLFEEPLRYVRLAEDWPAGTAETADALDRLDVPLGSSVRAARKALKDAGVGRGTTVVAAALRWRRESDIGPNQGVTRNTFETLPGIDDGNGGEQ